MKFVLSCYGTRGDVEPSVAVGCELLRRGHDVRLAVPPELIDFAESAGLSTVSYGPVLDDFLDEDFLRNFWTNMLHNPAAVLRQLWAPVARYWADTSATLVSLADGADLLSTGVNFEQGAANVADHYGIPSVALHHFPMRANGQLLPSLPSPLVRSAGRMSEWLFWRTTKKVENAQRRELGLPMATRPAPQRIGERRSLEIQAYDEACFRGLATEWSKWGDRRPFVGALTMEMTTEADGEVASWIAAGAPPICFATGSIPVESPGETVEMISAACAQLGQRALICFGGNDISKIPDRDHVKVVGAVNYPAIFSTSRAVVHHGGSGTTAASLRAGIPTLILWSSADQPYWGAQIKRLKLGTSRRFSKTTRETLIEDLRLILDPQYAVRARGFATVMSTPSESVARAADLFERTAQWKAD